MRAALYYYIILLSHVFPSTLNACLADFDGRVYTRSLLTCRFKTTYSTSRQDVLFSARCRYVLFAASSIFAHSILL